MKTPPSLSAVTPAAELRRCAEARLRKRQGKPRSGGEDPRSAADAQRLFHELQVHQIELEMQNAELLAAREAAEAALEKYIDLYDFAPVGYFSLDEQGRIVEVNLTGATLLGVERSRLLSRPLRRSLAPASQPVFLAFLEKVFAGTERQVCEVAILKAAGAEVWANIYGASASSGSTSRKGCRLMVSDITVLKQAVETARRAEALTATNRELRQLSQGIMQAQEEERKRISRELHDEITQTLVGITVHLSALAKVARINPGDLKKKIRSTQQLVEKSVNIVHRFARELRPSLLDDLGLIATLRSLMKEVARQAGVHVRFAAFSGVDELDGVTRTVIYRVIQSALANITQHAQASRVDVSIRKLPDGVRLEITDDGKSFDVERVMLDKSNKRLGLIGMRERLAMINGQFSVVSAPGEGTTIRAQIPIMEGISDTPAPGQG